jgi:hypothetical protein
VNVSDVVLNVVVTGSTFEVLHLFVASQLARSTARFRLVANGCPPEEVERMDRFAAHAGDRVVEVLPVSDVMVGHGVALDRVRALRHDGSRFGTIDPDIKANGPFVEPLVARLTNDCVVVTSGTELWSEDNLVPPAHPGVAGEHFVTADGFVFGSPHYAIYRRDALDATCERWGVGFGSAGGDLGTPARRRLEEMGLHYRIYDTGKLVNAFLQADGHRLVHEDLDQLVHIGGLAHFLAPTGWVTDAAGTRSPDWRAWGGHPWRYAVAQYTAHALRELRDGRPPPPVPPATDPRLTEKLGRAREESIDLVARYGAPTGTAAADGYSAEVVDLPPDRR